MVIQLEVQGELFQFQTYQQWVNKASHSFRRSGVPTWEILCVDTKGRACLIGSDFMRADRDNAYPVTAYHISLPKE